MEISGTNIGASTFAMKKAMEVPNILLNLLQQSADSGGKSLSMPPSPISTGPINLSAITGKGKIINIIA